MNAVIDTQAPALGGHGTSARSANLCRSCGRDFASLEAFDKHRVGTHGYTHEEGLAHGAQDGRRCLTHFELPGAGLELDRRGRWRMALSEAERTRLNHLQNTRGADGERSRATRAARQSQGPRPTLSARPPSEVVQ
jgi:hypothetical protein